MKKQKCRHIAEGPHKTKFGTYLYCCSCGEMEIEVLEPFAPSTPKQDVKKQKCCPCEKLDGCVCKCHRDDMRRAKLEAYDEFFLEVDKEFESFKIDEAMGKILHRLKAKEEGRKV